MTENTENNNIGHPQRKSIHDSVMASIDSGQIKMKPHWHFVTKGVLLVTGVALAALALVYISSFIIFMLHQTGVWYTPGFGSRGIQEFLVHLPWLLIGLAILFMILLQYLVKRFAFSYGQPLLYSAIAIIILVLAGGFIVSLTPVHRGLMQQAQDDHLPFAGGIYKQFGNPGERDNVTPGEILELVEKGYLITTPRNEVFHVIITPETRYPDGMDFIIGDKIVVVGDRIGDTIPAFGIVEVDDDFVMPRHQEDRRQPMMMR